MSICVPAYDDCQVCYGSGQTYDNDGYTQACMECWSRHMRLAINKGVDQYYATSALRPFIASDPPQRS